MSHSEFKDLILPTIQKSLLRSPENVIESRFLLRELLGGQGWPSSPVPLAGSRMACAGSVARVALTQWAGCVCLCLSACTHRGQRKASDPGTRVLGSCELMWIPGTRVLGSCELMWIPESSCCSYCRAIAPTHRCCLVRSFGRVSP